MAVRQYIGARYVPQFADPIEWDKSKAYESLTIVYYQGNSYTSRQAVPVGIEITNNAYWALTGNYNAQIEAYRAEVEQYAQQVQSFDGRITDNTESIAVNEQAIATETANRTSAVSNEANLRTQEDTKLQDQIDAINASRFLVIFGDSWANESSSSNTWMQKYADIKGLTIAKNYAVSGAGFIAAANPSNLISAQVTAAQSDSSFDKNMVAEVIVVGGVNDYRNSANANNAGSAVVNVMDALKSLYPNASCRYFLNCYEYGYPSSWVDSFVPNAFNDAFYSSLALMNGLFLNNYAFNDADLLHPSTEVGQNVIVKELLNNSSTGKYKYGRDVTFSSSQSGVNVSSCEVYRLPIGALLRLAISVTGQVSDQTTLTITPKYESLVSRYESVISIFGSSNADVKIGSGASDGTLVLSASPTQGTYYVTVLTPVTLS